MRNERNEKFLISNFSFKITLQQQPQQQLNEKHE